MPIHLRLVVLIGSALLCACGCAGGCAGAVGGAAGASFWPTCGNGVVDSGEKCDPLDGCPHSCPQIDSCQTPRLVGSPWTCTAECASDPITNCASGDGCCPAGCTLANDDDCFTYYVDATDGDDARDGRSPATAWKSMGKVNSTTLLPGESVGLKRGAVWRETLVISSSGAAGNPVRFGAYGSGNKPIINPTTVVTGWRVDSGSVWVADLTTPVRQLYFDGEFVPVAHDPNTGFHIIDVSVGAGTSLVDNELAPGGDLSGGTICIHTVPWDIEERALVSFDAATHSVLFDKATTYGMQQTAGYYLENRRWMLDSPGEWFFDASANKIYLWAPDGADPNRHVVEVSPLGIDATGPAPGQDGISGRNQHDIVVSDLAVRQAARYGVYLRDMGHLRLSRLDIRYAGGGGAPDPNVAFGKGIYVAQAPSTQADPSAIVECVVRDTVRQGISVVGADYMQILRNTVLRASVVGMPRHVDGAIAVSSSSLNPSEHMLIEGNSVDRTGLMGITYHVSNATIRQNVVNHACLVLNDCGGFYTWDGIETDLGLTGNVLENNIAMNAFGNTDGSERQDHGANGFYFDNRSNGVTARDNTAIANNSIGMYFSNGFHNTATGNTLYANHVQLDLGEHGWEGMTDFALGYVHDNAMTNNLFFATRDDQLNVQIASDFADPHVADFQGNLYAQPYNPLSIGVQRIDPWSQHFFSLEGWQAITANDPTGRTLAGTFQVASFDAGTVSSTELVGNGTFDTDITGWTVYPTEIPHRWVADCGLDGGCYQAEKNQAGVGQSLAYSPPFDLVAGTTYLLKFSMRASNFEQVRVIVMRHVSPWDTFFDRYIPVGPTRTDYALIVTVSESTRVRMVFSGGPTNGLLYSLDNVSLREASQVETNDPVDDSRIVFNASAQDQVIPLGDTSYCDVDDNVVTGAVTLGPFESKILLSCFCNHDGTCNNRETAQTCAGDCP